MNDGHDIDLFDSPQDIIERQQREIFLLKLNLQEAIDERKAAQLALFKMGAALREVPRFMEMYVSRK